MVFVVMDTVRADHTSLCGHDRPTTPNLDALAARGAHTCRAYAPGSWTLPSHASFFTGRFPIDHHADLTHAVDRPAGAPGVVRPLDGALPTLAEGFVAAGWRTLLVSQNPALSEKSGLTRGFSEAHISEHYGDQSAWSLTQLDAGLDAAAREAPLFIFLNLAEAHSPFPEVPAGVRWLPETDAIDCSFEDDQDLCWQIVRGEASPDVSARYFRAYKDAYDWGVHRADATLGAALARIEAARGAPSRIVVTSDHGELMGEHGFVGHGMYVLEEVTRVPIVVVGAALDAAEPMSAMVVHDLVATGRLPSPLPALRAFTVPGDRRAQLSHGKMPGQLAVTAWSGDTKTTLEVGRRAVVDLAADPHEVAAAVDQGVGDPMTPTLAAWRAVTEAPSGPGAAPLTEQLRALGYVK